MTDVQVLQAQINELKMRFDRLLTGDALIVSDAPMQVSNILKRLREVEVKAHSHEENTEFGSAVVMQSLNEEPDTKENRVVLYFINGSTLILKDEDGNRFEFTKSPL